MTGGRRQPEERQPGGVPGIDTLFDELRALCDKAAFMQLTALYHINEEGRMHAIRIASV